jgi:hypothetical protein
MTKDKKCSVSLCKNKAICKGLCSKHYQQKKLRGTIIEKDYIYIQGFCKMIGCGKKEFSKGFCQNHYIKDRKDKL